MKNKWRILCVMAALTLALTACGTSATESNDPSDKSDESSPVVETEGTEEAEEEGEVVGSIEEDDVEKDEVEVEVDTEIDDNSGNNPEKNDDDAANTEDDKNEIVKEATLTESDEQDYSMYVLPGYTLVSEEPGRDTLYLDSDDSLFMRVESIPNDKGAYDRQVENTKMLIEQTNEAEELVEITDASKLPSSDAIKSVIAYQINTEEGPVTGIVFESGNQVVRLTIFDSTDSKHYKDFLQMGETVATK